MSRLSTQKGNNVRQGPLDVLEEYVRASVYVVVEGAEVLQRRPVTELVLILKKYQQLVCLGARSLLYGMLG